MQPRLPLVERSEITELLDRHLVRAVDVHDQLKTRFWADPRKGDYLLVSDAMSVIASLQMDVDYLRGVIRDYEDYLSVREELEAFSNQL